MQNKSRAFTLIELLVVVLIIGILAAVAVPQYRLAVAKSRVTQEIQLVQALGREVAIYRLANNEWPKLSDLSLGPAVQDCRIESDGNPQYYMVLKCGNHYRARISTTGRLSGRYCVANKNNEFETKLCKHLTGKQTGPDILGDGTLKYDY